VGTALAAALVVGLLGAAVANSTSPDGLDRVLDRGLIARYAGHESLILWVANLGSAIQIVVLAAAVGALALVLRKPRGALLVVLALPLASGITELILKPLVHRTAGPAYAFPSGHSTGVFTLAFVVVLLMIERHRPVLSQLVRALVAVAAVAVAIAVAAALVAARYHYATDTVGGAGVALVIVLSVSLLIDALAERRRAAG
jgi:membrane-associated phospholipid phosphatase